MIDPKETCGDSSRALRDIDSPAETSEVRPQRRRRYRLLLVLAVSLLGLFWLNGPGLRLLAPRVALHFMDTAGLRGSFSVKGSLTGGFAIVDLKLEGDQELASLTGDHVRPIYQWRDLLMGRVDGLAIEGLHVDLRLGVEKVVGAEKVPLDFDDVVSTLRSIRGSLIPLALDFKGISVAATRAGESVFSLDSSRFIHQAGSDDFFLEIGVFTDATGKEWPAQKSSLRWNSDELSISRLAPLPSVSLRDFVIQLPASGGPSVEGQVAVDDAVFALATTAGLTSLRVDLVEGKLPLVAAARHFGVELSGSATVTSLALELNGLLPEPAAATGSLQILLEDAAWQGWASPEISLDAAWLTDRATIATRALVLGTEFSVQAEAPLKRAGATFQLGAATGSFNIADVAALLGQLAERTTLIDPNATVPPSAVGGNFEIGILDNRIQAASADWKIQPHEENSAPAIGVKSRWQVDQPITAELAVEGLALGGTYHMDSSSYQAALTVDDFSLLRMDPWLAIVKVRPEGITELTGEWSGSGVIKSGKHRGELSLTDASWQRADAPPIVATGMIGYDWPGKVEAEGLRLEMNGQTIALDANLADGFLRLDPFVWRDGENDIASCRASFPVPTDFSKWREFLANDVRPVEVSIDTRVLSLGFIKPWMPALEPLDSSSTGRLQVGVSGTYSEPVIDAVVHAKDLRSPAHPGLPPADLRVTLKAADQKAVLEATVTAPDFPAGVLKASMPFHPSEWAADPELLVVEPLVAKLDLPRLDLSRFTTLVPAAEQLGGFLTGELVATGNLKNPVIKGALSLAGGSVQFKNPGLPDIEKIGAAVDLELGRITLKSLKSEIAGGVIDGRGSIEIANGKLGEIDVRVSGDHLPVLRNELLILRANMDLRLLGPWDGAVLSGTIGTVDSVFYRDIELLPIGRPFNNPSAAALPKIDPPEAAGGAVPEPFRNWRLDLLARSEEPFLIRGNLATGQVTGGIRIGGTVGNPLPDGVVTIENFRASLPFSTLDVRSGTATFSPANGFDPVLEIRGTAEPRPYRVTVYAHGRMSNPQLVLTSNPPLPDNEIMTLLATGTTTSGLEDPQAASSRALQLLAEELRRGRFRFGRQLRPLLGLLDKVDFSLADEDPYSADSFSTATISLADRWFLSAGMGGEGDSRFMVIWRLSFR